MDLYNSSTFPLAVESAVRNGAGMKRLTEGRAAKELFTDRVRWRAVAIRRASRPWKKFDNHYDSSKSEQSSQEYGLLGVYLGSLWLCIPDDWTINAKLVCFWAMTVQGLHFFPASQTLILSFKASVFFVRIMRLRTDFLGLSGLSVDSVSSLLLISSQTLHILSLDFTNPFWTAVFPLSRWVFAYSIWRWV